MFESDLNEAVRSLRPSDALRAKVIEAALSEAARGSMLSSEMDRRIGLLQGSRPEASGEYNPDYYKNMVTRFTLCDPDDAEHLQGLILSVSK